MAPSQGVIRVLPILELLRLGDKVNALICNGQLELLCHRLWHLTVRPNLLELARVFGLQQQVGFDEFLEHVALLLRRHGAQPPLDTRPG